MPRLLLALLAALTIAAGLGVHRFAPESILADAAGDVLYAVLIVLLLAVVAPRSRWWILGGAALTWCIGVELLQFTSIPAQLGEAFAPVRLILGTTFAAADLLWYVVGVAIGVGMLAVLRSSGSSDIVTEHGDSPGFESP